MARADATSPVDILVVGGGINGVGIARDAVGRGYSVVLCERDDLGSATSSASSKLIHGGLRYLEQYEFRLVREALIEREVLLRAAPHIIWPLRFILPHDRTMRPAWLVRLGLFLYDHLGGRKLLPRSRGLDLAAHPAGAKLKPAYRKAFIYSDCWVEDARLVVLNARDAADRGARVLTRTALASARREDGLWRAELVSEDGTTHHVTARALVNAAGPWVSDVLNHRAGMNAEKRVRLVKGSHIVVPKLHDADEAFILQNDDRRIVFVIPYQRHYSLIGTTDMEFDGDPATLKITEGETAYLCGVVNRYFAKPIGPDDIVWTYSGVRPLYDDASANPSAVTRDYVFDINGGANGGSGETAPVLSVFGGKITTFRKLAEHALDKLQPLLGGGGAPWTASAALPGGDIPNADFEGFLAKMRTRYPWLPEALCRRYARAYGTCMDTLIGDAGALDELGPHLGDNVHAAELRYLMAYEFARTGEDVLWRRSKLGLHVTADTAAAVGEWMRAHATERAA